MSAQSPSDRSPVPAPRPGGRPAWLGMAIVGAVLIVALTGCLLAARALLRPSAPRTHRVHMTTDTPGSRRPGNNGLNSTPIEVLKS